MNTKKPFYYASKQKQSDEPDDPHYCGECKFFGYCNQSQGYTKETPVGTCKEFEMPVAWLEPRTNEEIQKLLAKWNCMEIPSVCTVGSECPENDPRQLLSECENDYTEAVAILFVQYDFLWSSLVFADRKVWIYSVLKEIELALNKLHIVIDRECRRSSSTIEGTRESSGGPSVKYIPS